VTVAEVNCLPCFSLISGEAEGQRRGGVKVEKQDIARNAHTWPLEARPQQCQGDLIRKGPRRNLRMGLKLRTKKAGTGE